MSNICHSSIAAGVAVDHNGNPSKSVTSGSFSVELSQ